MKPHHIVFAIAAVAAIATVWAFLAGPFSARGAEMGPVIAVFTLFLWVFPLAALAVFAFFLAAALRERALGARARRGRLFVIAAFLWVAGAAAFALYDLYDAGYAGNAMHQVAALAGFFVLSLPGLVLLWIGYRMRRTPVS